MFFFYYYYSFLLFYFFLNTKGVGEGRIVWVEGGREVDSSDSVVLFWFPLFYLSIFYLQGEGGETV